MTEEIPPPELNPCPFCGDKLAHIWTPAHSGYSVICGNGCGAEGPVMENEGRAAEAWNRRATISAELREALAAASTALQERGEFHIYQDGKVYTRAQCIALARLLDQLAAK